MAAPKIIVEGATYAVTRRCAFRKLFLTPLTPMVHEGVGYLLATAAQATGVIVNHAVVMPNHIHLVVTSTQPNVPKFKELFFGEVGKFIKVALAEHGFEPPERVFGDGGRHQQRLIGAAAQMTYLHYQDVNTVSAGLVERVEHYPGLSTDLGLLIGGGMVVKRPPIYVDRRRHPAERVMPTGCPPELREAYGSSREVAYQLSKLRSCKEQALGQARDRPVLGPLGVTQQHPWSEPRSPRRFEMGATPSFLVVGDDELRVRCALETREHRERYREAREARRAGREAVFPYGTYAMRVHHGAPVEPVEATEGRVVNAPGPLHPKPLSRDAKRALHGELRAEAITARQEELEDSLAARLEAARHDAVDRRAAIRVGADEVRAGTEEDGDPPRAERSKQVVLRSSTASACRRRQELQAARSDAAPTADSRDDTLDVEPPFE